MPSPGHASDAELIAATLAGETAAFGEIVRRYEGVVAATVIGMMGPGGEAEDVGQEVMIKLYRSLDRFRGAARLKTYVTRIAMNAALDALRRRKRALRHLFTPETHGDDTRGTAWGDAWQDQLPSGDDHARDLENRQTVQAALARLKPEFRSVAVLRLMQGYSVEEVATILDVAHGTVLSRLSRAKKQLKDLLKGEFGHE